MGGEQQQQLLRVRNAPRISAPKLGEYMDASAHRRESIVRAQKLLTAFMAPRYSEAHNVIRDALLAGDGVKDRVIAAARQLDARITTTKFRTDTKRCCVDALRAFADIHATLPLKGITMGAPGRRALGLVIEGVKVSVFPTATLAAPGKRGSIERGALLLVYRKEAALDVHGGKVVAEILRRAIVRAGAINVAPRLCIVVDVFGGMAFEAPARNRRLTMEIESACREIAIRWPMIAA